MILKELAIIRTEWLTPDRLYPGELSSLENAQGLKCCLGFACKQISPSSIRKDISMPHETDCKLLCPQFVTSHPNGEASETELARNAAFINDDAVISNTEREEKLIKLFAQHQIKLTFTD